MLRLMIWTAVAGSIFFAAQVCHAMQPVTVKGVTYSDAEVIKEYPKSVYISHAAGKTFINKADISVEDARALGVANPVVDGFQQTPDKDIRELQTGKSYVPSAPLPAARRGPAIPSQISKQASRLGITPEALQASRGMDARGQWAMLGAGTEVSRKRSTAPESRRMELPMQRYMRPSDASTVRLAMFAEGLLPLKESEARDLFAGREISPLSSRCALDAFKAAKVMLGQLGPEHLPQPYGALVQPRANVASRVTAATPRGPNSIPFEPWMSAASVAPPHTRPVATMGVDSHVHRIWHGADGSAAFPAALAPAHAQPVAATSGDVHVHRMWHGADGSSATQLGNALFHSDGRISHGAFPAAGQFNTFHGSDGSVLHQSGNAMFPAGGGAGMFGAP